MTTLAPLKSIFLVTTVLFAANSFAITPAEDDRKECKKPKFRDFMPADKAVDVAPESEVSFHVSRGTELHTIKATARGEKLPLEVKNRVTYVEVKTRLPATLQDGYVRIHVTADAAEGGCTGADGWLIKLKEPAASTADATPNAAAAAP
jgi:hypothetical protein